MLALTERGIALMQDRFKRAAESPHYADLGHQTDEELVALEHALLSIKRSYGWAMPVVILAGSVVAEHERRAKHPTEPTIHVFIPSPTFQDTLAGLAAFTSLAMSLQDESMPNALKLCEHLAGLMAMELERINPVSDE